MLKHIVQYTVPVHAAHTITIVGLSVEYKTIYCNCSSFRLLKTIK